MQQTDTGIPSQQYFDRKEKEQGKSMPDFGIVVEKSRVYLNRILENSGCMDDWREGLNSIPAPYGYDDRYAGSLN